MLPALETHPVRGRPGARRTIILLVACSSFAAVGPASLTQAETLPILQDIEWHHIRAYCTFRRTGQPFDYNDPDTWRFVYFTHYASGVMRDSYDFDIDPQTAFVNLRHQLRQLELIEAAVTAHGMHRTYKSYGAPTHRVVLDVTKQDTGYEHAGFAGTLSVSGPFGDEKVEVQGDCGV